MNNISKTFTSYNELYNNLVKTNNIEICKFCLDNDGIWKELTKTFNKKMKNIQ